MLGLVIFLLFIAGALSCQNHNPSDMGPAFGLLIGLLLLVLLTV